MEPNLNTLVRILENLPPETRQAYIEDFLAQIESNETAPASLQDVYDAALRQIAAGQTLSMDEFCARAQSLDAVSDAIEAD